MRHWKEFKIPHNMFLTACAYHRELVDAAVRGLNGKSTSWENEDRGRNRVQDIRNTTILGADGRHIRVRLEVPEPVVDGHHHVADYGLWLNVTGWLGKDILEEHEIWNRDTEGELDLCANTSFDPGKIWYMSEMFSVVGAGMVKDMFDCGAICLKQILDLSEKAQVEDERYLTIQL